MQMQGRGGAPHLQRGTSSISDPTGCGSSGIARQQGGMEHDECIVKLATEHVGSNYCRHVCNCVCCQLIVLPWA